MNRRMGSNRSGFTLIELLVVVAIIALLISILLPSLSKARAQARTTVCASRITQLSKAMMIYADDFDETLPFIGMAQADWDDMTPTGKMDRGDMYTEYQWMMWEDWLMPNMPDLWALYNGGIGPEDEARALIRQGSLFPYVRFEQLYRCPEFERIPPVGDAQRLFNYTRTWLGRKLLSGLLGDCNDYTGEPLPAKIDGDGLAAGKIVKLSQAYAPAAYWMMVDEQYDKHVGADSFGYNPPDEPEGIIGSIGGMPMCADCVFTIVGDEIGRYHGAKGRVVNTELGEQIPLTKQGSVAHYDGHVSLMRDPLPDRHVEAGSLGDLLEEAVIVWNFLMSQLYAQRGLDLGMPAF